MKIHLYEYNKMDDIDITDSVFSLSNYNLGDDSITSSSINLMSFENYYIYIGLFVCFLFAGLFLYRHYQNKKESEPLDSVCEGGFCNMNNKDLEV